MPLTDGKNPAEVNANLEAYKKENWELNLGLTPGFAKQQWTLWPKNGHYLEGNGEAAEIARDLCIILTGRGR